MADVNVESGFTSSDDDDDDNNDNTQDEKKDNNNVIQQQSKSVTPTRSISKSKSVNNITKSSLSSSSSLLSSSLSSLSSSVVPSVPSYTINNNTPHNTQKQKCRTCPNHITCNDPRNGKTEKGGDGHFYCRKCWKYWDEFFTTTSNDKNDDNNDDNTRKCPTCGKKILCNDSRNGKFENGGDGNFYCVECWKIYDKIVNPSNNINTAQNVGIFSCVPNPVIPQKYPKKQFGAYFSGLSIGGTYIPWFTNVPYIVDNFSEYVDAGSYPSNIETFSKSMSVTATLDGIVIDKNTRVIIYEKENFQGNILLNKIGPAIINNMKWKHYCLLESETPNDPQQCICGVVGVGKRVTYLGTFLCLDCWKLWELVGTIMTQTFPDPELQNNFPPRVRYWSCSDMHSWRTGSVKITEAT